MTSYTLTHVWFGRPQVACIFSDTGFSGGRGYCKTDWLAVNSVGPRILFIPSVVLVAWAVFNDLAKRPVRTVKKIMWYSIVRNK